MHSRTAVVLLLIALASPLTLGCGSSSMGPPATNRDGDIPAGPTDKGKVDVKVRTPGADVDVHRKGTGRGVDVDVRTKDRGE